MTMKLLEHIDLASDIVVRSKRIGIKPNLINATPASHGATTHPEILDGLLTYLKRKGFRMSVYWKVPGSERKHPEQ